MSDSQRAPQPQASPSAEPADTTALMPKEFESLHDGLAAIERGETFSREQAAAHLDAHIRAALAATRRR